MNIQMVRLSDRATKPEYMSAGASGCDVFSCLDKPVVVRPMERAAIPTGFAVEVPYGFEIQVRPRSGLSWKNGLTLVNAPGTIDSDYRGEVRVLLVNLGNEPFEIVHGMRIAQLVLSKVERIEWVYSGAVQTSNRGSAGFGSTGLY